MLVAICLISGAMLMGPVLFSGLQLGQLNARQTVQSMNHEKAVMIDLRDAQEFAKGHVLGAKNIPWAELKDKLPTQVKNKSVPLIFVCTKGSTASRAMPVAKSLGYEKPQYLSGGLKTWLEANLPLEKKV